MKTIFKTLAGILMTTTLLCPTMTFAQPNNQNQPNESEDPIEAPEKVEYSDDVSAVEDNPYEKIDIRFDGKYLYIDNCEENTVFQIFDTNGRLAISTTTSPIDVSNLPYRFYILKAGYIRYAFRK